MIIIVFCAVIGLEGDTSLDAAISNDIVLRSFLILTTLLSLRGIPPFRGFFIKLYIISGLVSKGLILLSLLILLVSSFSVYIYLKTIFKYMSLTSLIVSFNPINNYYLNIIVYLNLISGLLLFFL